LNVLGGYAAHDHRAMADQAKKACIRIPSTTVRDDCIGLDGHIIRRFAAVRIRGRDIHAIISLLERR